MASTRTVRGKCARCGTESDHDIIAAYTKGIGFGFALECPACGMVVPEQAWQRYQRTGDVIVSMSSKRTDRFPKGSKNYI